jgi:hypothetical protein
MRSTPTATTPLRDERLGGSGVGHSRCDALTQIVTRPGSPELGLITHIA